MRQPSGFTLIEILVVLFIVSMLTGLVVANLPGFVSRADYEEEMQRLNFALNQGLAKAEIEASEVGVMIYADGYEFLVYDELTNGWIPALERSLIKHRLPETLRLVLALEGEPIRLGGPDADEEEQGATELDEVFLEPSVLLLSSGETSIFELELMTNEGWWMGLSSDGYGNFELHREPFERE